jgi:hypothetical protein
MTLGWGGHGVWGERPLISRIAPKRAAGNTLGHSWPAIRFTRGARPMAKWCRQTAELYGQWGEWDSVVTVPS